MVPYGDDGLATRSVASTGVINVMIAEERQSLCACDMKTFIEVTLELRLSDAFMDE